MSEDNIDSQISNLEGRLESAGYDSDSPPPKAETDKPSIFDESREGELRSSLAKIYDENHAAQERAQELQIVPSITPSDSTTTAFEKTYDYLHASPKEQATQRDASQLIDQLLENSAKFWVQFSDTDAMMAAMELEREQARATPSIPAELQPSLLTIQQNYPGRQAHEVVSEFAQIDSDFKRDPINTAFRVLQERTGISPLEIVRQVAAAHSPQEHQAFYAQRDAEVVASAFMAAYPDVDQEAVVAALSKFPRSGNMAADLAKAYEMAGRRPSRPSRKGARRSMESEMSEVWSRLNSR